MEIIIRPLQDHNTAQITELILNIQQNEFNLPISIEDQPDLLTIESFYISPGGTFLGAFAEDELVGTIALIRFDGHSGAIRKMFVKKEFRGKELNIAQKLFESLTACCRSAGIRNLFLGTVDVLKAARRFYERNGFVQIDRLRLPHRFPVMNGDQVFYGLELEGDERD